MIGLFSLPVAGLSWLNDHTLAAPVLCLQFRLVPLAFFAMVILEKQWQRRVGDVWRFDKGKPSLARMRIFLLWMAKPTCTVWVLLFAIAFGDLSSYLQCLPPGVTPISMRIFDLLHYGVRSSEAGLLLFLALLGSGLGWWLHRNLSQRLP
jgi:ABC-type Fe3+ transport system permease subunit